MPTPSGLINTDPRGDVLGYDAAAVLSPADQFNDLIVKWNQAYVLSKPAAQRAMMMLRQAGQGGTFATEPEAIKARALAAATLPNIDYVIDVFGAGLGAYQTLTNRALNPFGLGSTALPDLSKPPAPHADLQATNTPQPFVDWGNHTDTGSPVWDALAGDKSEVGATWTGLAKHTSTVATYVKVRDYPWGVIRDRWFVKA